MELKGMVTGRVHNQRGYCVQVSIYNVRGEQLGNVVVEVPTKEEYDLAPEGSELQVVLGFGTKVTEVKNG